MIYSAKTWLLFGASILSSVITCALVHADGLEVEHPELAVEQGPAVTLPQAPTGEFTLEAVGKRIAATVSFLSSDELQGRGLGKAGLTQAAQHIANGFASAGLRTDLWDGLPYQNFYVDNMTMMGSTANNRLSIVKPEGTRVDLRIGEDYQPMAVGGNGYFDGNVVFVGYGITANLNGITYDDYLGIDVKDKVVMVLRKEPQQSDANSPFNGVLKTDHALFSTKVANAKLHGAKAMLLINDFVSVSGSGLKAAKSDIMPSFDSAGKSNPHIKLPTAFITRDVAEQLIRAQYPDESLINLEKKIDATLQPQSLTVPSINVSGAIELTQQKLITSNVVAIQPGAGSLANETVVIGAHYDHVGMGEYGSLAAGVHEIHNGADDNASGTSALLELARRIAAGRQANQPANCRKIVFAAFSGEERGLLGSKYYVKHPAHDLSQTAAMINLDMIGRLGSNRIIVYGIGSSPDFGRLVTDMATAEGLEPELQRPAMGPSDHQPFFEAGIPVLHFFTGIHPQYHRPSDDFDKINTTGIARITDMVYQVVEQIAQQDVRPEFVQVSGRANIQIPSLEHGALGVQLRGDQSVPTISKVLPDQAAEHAGLMLNDQIVEINHRSVDSTSKLLAAMQALMPKDEITVTVLRDEQKLEISVILGHY